MRPTPFVVPTQTVSRAPQQPGHSLSSSPWFVGAGPLERREPALGRDRPLPRAPSPRARAGASSWSPGRGAAMRRARPPARSSGRSGGPRGDAQLPAGRPIERELDDRRLELGRRPVRRQRLAPGERLERHLAPVRRLARSHRGHGPPHRGAPRSGGSRRASSPSPCRPARRRPAARAELQEPHPRSGRGQAPGADDLLLSGHARRSPAAEAGRPTTPTAPRPASALTSASRPHPSDQVPTSTNHGALGRRHRLGRHALDDAEARDDDPARTHLAEKPVQRRRPVGQADGLPLEPDPELGAQRGRQVAMAEARLDRGELVVSRVGGRRAKPVTTSASMPICSAT